MEVTLSIDSEVPEDLVKFGRDNGMTDDEIKEMWMIKLEETLDKSSDDTFDSMQDYINDL